MLPPTKVVVQCSPVEGKANKPYGRNLEGNWALGMKPMRVFDSDNERIHFPQGMTLKITIKSLILITCSKQLPLLIGKKDTATNVINYFK